MITLEHALTHLLDHAHPLGEMEHVPLLHALGRLLGEAVHARINVPPFANSSMDGYALNCADWQAEHALPISQRITAGMTAQSLLRGSAARIFTGAPIPEGADAVVMQEHCEVSAQQVRILRAPMPGQCIRQVGEAISLGDSILGAGARLSAAQLGLLASTGVASILSPRRLRVAVFFTGDELAEPGEALTPGRIYNANRYSLHALLAQSGCVVRDLGTIPDSLAATRLALVDAAGTADVVITCGGVSVGDEDYVKAALEKEGSLDLWQIAMKPGKPFAFGRIGQADFIGLPGNPVSAFVTYLCVVVPFLKARMGYLRAECIPTPLMRQAAFGWPNPDAQRLEFLRVRQHEGMLVCYPQQGSAVLSSCAWADGLVRVEPGQVIQQGDWVSYLPFSALL